MKSRYDPALIANDAGIPSFFTDSAASAGPTARAMLNVIEFSATAEGSSSRGTSCEMKAVDAGALKALEIPSPKANAITTHWFARPDHASTARTALRIVARAWVRISSRRRSNRSAALPAHGASASTGMKLAKLSTPRRNAECVSRNTSSCAARFWNHVPLADEALPTKYGPNLGDRIRPNAARGPAGRAASIGQSGASKRPNQRLRSCSTGSSRSSFALSSSSSALSRFWPSPVGTKGQNAPRL